MSYPDDNVDVVGGGDEMLLSDEAKNSEKLQYFDTNGNEIDIGLATGNGGQVSFRSIINFLHFNCIRIMMCLPVSSSANYNDSNSHFLFISFY